MAVPRGYRTFADFERREIRPGMRIGWSMDEVEQGDPADFDLDADPFEAMLDAASEAVHEDDDEEDE